MSGPVNLAMGAMPGGGATVTASEKTKAPIRVSVR
jgi:hypothetical protein